MTDLLLFIIVILIGACGAMAWRLHQQRLAAVAATKRSEEWWLWAELHRTEADAARARVHVLERRYATLQTLYADLVRQRLAANWVIVQRHRAWRRSQ
jgi:hypothetical protein